jgi:hypothetical protein
LLRCKKNKKGVIVSYGIDGLGWVSKEDGVELACRDAASFF